MKSKRGKNRIQMVQQVHVVLNLAGMSAEEEQHKSSTIENVTPANWNKNAKNTPAGWIMQCVPYADENDARLVVATIGWWYKNTIRSKLSICLAYVAEWLDLSAKRTDQDRYWWQKGDTKHRAFFIVPLVVLALCRARLWTKWLALPRNSKCVDRESDTSCCNFVGMTSQIVMGNDNDGCFYKGL